MHLLTFKAPSLNIDQGIKIMEARKRSSKHLLAEYSRGSYDTTPFRLNHLAYKDFEKYLHEVNEVGICELPSIPGESIFLAEHYAERRILFLRVDHPSIWSAVKPSHRNGERHIHWNVSLVIRKKPFRVIVIPYDLNAVVGGSQFDILLRSRCGFTTNLEEPLFRWLDRLKDRECPAEERLRFLKALMERMNLGEETTRAIQQSKQWAQMHAHKKKGVIL